MQTASTPPLVEVRHLAKAFGGVRALRDASLVLLPGEIHALLGENGAGKSTLLKSLAGVHRADSGEILVDAAPFEQGSTRRALEQGVAVIYQEPGLFPDLTLAENVFIGRRPTRRGGAVDWARMRREAGALFAQLGVDLDPDRRAEGLSIADQQIVEIAKALSTDARVIVMDEPTAALSAAEADRLLAVARRLRDGGAAVVFVSHRLDEVFALCDRLTVMRDGATVASVLIADTTPAEVVRWMVGRELTERFPKLDTRPGEVVLRVRGLRRIRHLRNVMGLWMLSQTLQTWERAGRAPSLPELLAAAAQVPDGGPVVDADDLAFLPPGDMPARITEACRTRGQPVPGDPAAVVRCILDSLAAAYARAIDTAERLSGHEVDVVHVVGGGSHNHVLCELTARATGRPVVAGPAEATALGNALVQARAVGTLSGGLEELRAVVARTTPADTALH